MLQRTPIRCIHIGMAPEAGAASLRQLQPPQMRFSSTYDCRICLSGRISSMTPETHDA